MSTPDPGSTMHIASVDYAVSFSQLASVSEPVIFSAPGATHYIFTFDTGVVPADDGSFTVTYSSSWWNQAAAEAAIATALDSICQSIATMLGLTLAQVQSAVTVRRLWTYNQNSYSIIPGVTSGPQKMIWPDLMAYPSKIATAGLAASTATALQATVVTS